MARGDRLETFGYIIQFKNGMYGYTDTFYGTEDITKTRVMELKEVKKDFRGMKKLNTWRIQDGIQTEADRILNVKITVEIVE